MKRALLLLVVVVVGVGLDQWTKAWADRTLGTVDHPLPFTITQAEDGALLGEIVARRFDLGEDELRTIADRGPGGLVSLYDKARPTPDDEAFPVFDGEPRLAFWWVFDEGRLDSPPRRVPDVNRSQRHLERYGGEVLDDYFAEVLPHVDAETRARLFADGLVYPVVHTPQPLAKRVVAGDTYLLLHRPVSVVDGFLQLSYAENPGAAWGFLADAGATFRRWFFLIVSLVAAVIIGVMYWRLREEQWLAAWGFAGILSGAVGNFVDRIRYQYVIDFVDTYVGASHWPTFNVADVAITIGVGLLLVEIPILGDRSFLAGAAPDAPAEPA